MKICVYGAASSEIDKKYIETGEEFGRKLANNGHSLIFGGGKNGMMGAVARGVHQANGKIVGIIPRFFEESGAEISFTESGEIINTDTMRERKQLLEEKSDAFVMVPGGIGTFDEFFEILTLKQLGRHNKPIVIFNIEGYYDELLKMLETSTDEKFITKETKDLYQITNSTEETIKYLESYIPTEIDMTKVKIR